MPCERMHAEYATYDPELNDPLAVGEPPEFPHPAKTRTAAATASMPHERSGRRVWTSIIGTPHVKGRLGTEPPLRCRHSRSAERNHEDSVDCPPPFRVDRGASAHPV